jgi:hypothetical protein
MQHCRYTIERTPGTCTVQVYTHSVATTQSQNYDAAVDLSGVACIRPSTTAANGFAADESGYASKNDLHERI